MAKQSVMELDGADISRLGPALAALVDLRENEILSLCKQVFDAAFAESPGIMVMELMLRASGTMSLRDIALRCDRGKRAILPHGKLRGVVERLVKAGLLVNYSTPEKPRYSLDKGDRRVQILVRMYGPVRFIEVRGDV